MLSKQEIAGLRDSLRRQQYNTIAVQRDDLSALLDIAEAVANAQTFEAVPSDHVTGCEVTIPLPMGTRIAVLPLAGES